MEKTKNKWIFFSLRLMMLIAAVAGLAFTAGKQQEVTCRDLIITVSYEDEHVFITREKVDEWIFRQFGNIRSLKLSQVPLHRIETALNDAPEVHKAEVYATPDGYVYAHVQQRRPIARVINNRGEGFYFDSRGKLMPLSGEFIARVPVFSGNINFTYDGYFYKTLPEINDSVGLDMNQELLQSMYRLAKTIDENTFWKHMTEQVYVDSLQFTLIPKIGEQNILLGDGNRPAEKLHNMFLFYREGIAKVGWNKYEAFDLRFAGQVVAKRKTITDKSAEN